MRTVKQIHINIVFFKEHINIVIIYLSKFQIENIKYKMKKVKISCSLSMDS